MPIIATHNLQPGDHPLLQRAIYNALDCCVTLEVFEELRPLQGNSDHPIYSFERALQAPILEMMLRGFRIDEYQRQRGCAFLRAELDVLSSILNDFACAVWGRGLNPQSPKQLIDFFYKHMKLPEIWISQKGIKRISTNREALEKLDVYFHARPIIACILAIRDRKKQLSVLETEVSSDGRMRTSYNIAGTESGRLSSSGAADGTGTNLQNIAGGLRGMFIADQAWKLCGIDLEQAESREVGWLCGTLFGDWSYLNAAYSGDLHTTVCKMTWEKLPWTGDNKKDKAIAEQPFYREYSYRDMAKKLGHGCLTEDHDVLTRNGWIPISDKPSEILIWDKTKSYFGTVSHWEDFEYSGQLHRFNGRSMDALMTPEHRIPYKNAQGGIWREQIAKQGPGRFMPLGNGYVGNESADRVPAKLIAAFMCDGTQHSTNNMRFHFTKQRKKSRLEKLCLEYGYEFVYCGEDYITVRGVLPKSPGAFQLEWHPDDLRDFVLELRHWDGSINGSLVYVCSQWKTDLEWYQTFGRILGIGGTLQKPRISGYGTLIYKLQQNKRQFASGECLSHTKQSVVNTRVLCPSVESSWFYVRRNGKIFITGNSNYYGAPFTMARHAKIPVQLATSFQENYFAAFEGIPKWHRYVAQQLQTTQKLVTPFGRERHFFGRPGDDATLREAIAFSPQSATADRTNLILYRIWKTFGARVQLLAQVHDAVYLQFKAHEEQEIIPAILELFKIKMVCGKHELIVPGEAKLGWNWGIEVNEDSIKRWEMNGRKGPKPSLNPDGLRKFKLGSPDPRKRTTILNRTL